ncbi:hypothetical protein BDQ12DRAFT_668980 [Crucibulum laeve]|uniref:SH3 domain-containing protein n=1 Tax=Crucibulum laeve TaxID=68775 RepID=A0A5C3LQG6_9AGAR|nr:hypothetical protein BDQ12DRAFT_668980 [Crucibulum laeve]
MPRKSFSSVEFSCYTFKFLKTLYQWPQFPQQYIPSNHQRMSALQISLQRQVFLAVIWKKHEGSLRQDKDLNKPAKALYTYKATRDKPDKLSFVRGDILQIKEIKGLWWHAKKADGTEGVALSLYLQIIPPDLIGKVNDNQESKYTSSISLDDDQGFSLLKVKALVDYDAGWSNPQELSFKKGKTIEVMDTEGFWLPCRQSNGTIGITLSDKLYIVTDFPRKAEALYNLCVFISPSKDTANSEDPKEIDLQKGELIDILPEDTNKWWPAWKADGSVGNVPSNYIKVLPEATTTNKNPTRSDSSLQPSENEQRNLVTAKTDTLLVVPKILESSESQIREITMGHRDASNIASESSITYQNDSEQRMIESKTEADSPITNLDPNGNPVGDMDNVMNTHVKREVQSNDTEDTKLENKDALYKVKALYAYPHEISFKKGNILEVIKDADKWWPLTQREDGTIGIIPSNYVVALIKPQCTAGFNTDHSMQVGGFRYKGRVLYRYEADPTDTNELSFTKGDILDIQDIDGKWWVTRNKTRKTGVAPSGYVQIIPEAEEEEEELAGTYRKQPAAQTPEVSERASSLQDDNRTSSTSSHHSIRDRSAMVGNLFNMESQWTPYAKDQLINQNDKPQAMKTLPSAGRDRPLPDVNVSGTGTNFGDLASAAQNQIVSLTLQKLNIQLKVAIFIA